MKVSVPSSTYGRNVSCCALLKRCTSSRNSTLRRPRSARAVRARSTASRMSLTPAMTAESCMNSASARRAISRASVVLPVPGGPQRISECSWPFSSAWRSGLPGAEHLLLADEFIERARPHAIGQRPQRIVGSGVAQEVGLPAGTAGRRAGSLQSSAALTTMRRTPASARVRDAPAAARAARRGNSRSRRAGHLRGPTCM